MIASHRTRAKQGTSTTADKRHLFLAIAVCLGVWSTVLACLPIMQKLEIKKQFGNNCYVSNISLLLLVRVKLNVTWIRRGFAKRSLQLTCGELGNDTKIRSVSFVRYMTWSNGNKCVVQTLEFCRHSPELIGKARGFMCLEVYFYQSGH